MSSFLLADRVRADLDLVHRELRRTAPLLSAVAIVLRAARATIASLRSDDAARAELLELYADARYAYYQKFMERSDELPS